MRHTVAMRLHRTRAVPAAVLSLCLVSSSALAPSAAAGQPSADPVRCPALDPRGSAADPDLYCIGLVHAPDFPGVSGYVELTPSPSPFGASVTAGGNHRFDLTLHAAGLPDAASLGDYLGYVAWAATPRLRPVVNLGPVANGRTALPPVDLDKFLVLVTAEAAPDGPAWGRTHRAAGHLGRHAHGAGGPAGGDRDGRGRARRRLPRAAGRVRRCIRRWR